TVEHVAALDALGVRHGVLAATRSDLGDAGLAIAEARERLAGTSLEDIEAVTVSPVAGVGLDDLRTALLRLTKQMPQTYSPATRLWIDRVFTIRGVGTVVTGTLASGRISVGDELLVASSGEAVRVRGLETLKSAVPSVDAVSRVAVNLRGTKSGDLIRGDALIGRDWWARVDTVDVRLVNPPQRLPTELALHVGSAAVAARVRPLGNDTARLSLRSPLPLHIGERAILRDPGEQHVVSGIIVLDTMPPDLGRRGAAARRAAELDVMTGDPDPAREVQRRRAVRRDRLVAAGVLDPSAGTPGGAVRAGAWLIADDQWRAWRAEIGAVLDDWSSTHPMSPGMPSPAVTRQLGLPDQELLALIVSSVDDVTLDGDGVHRLGVVPTLPPRVEAGLAAMVARLASDPFDAATGPELDAAGLTDAHLSTAVKNGRLLRVAASVFLAPNAVDEAARRLASLPQPFTMSAAREALATTRRVSVPLLELLDRRGITLRTDDQRRTMRS
ncbi:MAG TPA: SelB C-terminal domain-containing protein, partial [Micromonosporaceae bacterium]